MLIKTVRDFSCFCKTVWDFSWSGNVGPLVTTESHMLYGINPERHMLSDIRVRSDVLFGTSAKVACCLGAREKVTYWRGLSVEVTCYPA